MLNQVVCILAPFFTFVTNYFPTRAHNMLVIILELRFKNMKVVHEFVGNDAMPQGIMKENDQNIILPLLVYSHFNIMNAPIS
jgi:hypothetical protein